MKTDISFHAVFSSVKKNTFAFVQFCDFSVQKRKMLLHQYASNIIIAYYAWLFDTCASHSSLTH